MSDEIFAQGQRWISDTETQLGLGIVESTENRRVTILFPGANETRQYAIQSALLTRVKYNVGDTVHAIGGEELHIYSISEEDSTLTYHGKTAQQADLSLHERDLDTVVEFQQAVDRLLNCIVDSPKWFAHRYLANQSQNKISASPAHGLIGGRTDLLPHQLYIAHEVAKRFAPRVLLADEVGLGKTIEAGYIIHRQHLNGMARRILIVVPEALVHQWLVEMIRRFNLMFSVFDKARIESNLAEDPSCNPFQSEQLILCSLDTLIEDKNHFLYALSGEWDMLVVDEAHHLGWQDEEPSLEYSCVELIAQKTPGLLLLTATPEQLGKQGHFARLRLLDPDRYSDLETYISEEDNFVHIAQLSQLLFENQTIPQDQYKRLLDTIQSSALHKKIEEGFNGETFDDEKLRSEIISHLIDVYGTGRVLFRNTRETVKGFPERIVCPHPLDSSDTYSSLYNNIDENIDTKLLCTPELLLQSMDDLSLNWVEQDARVTWLEEFALSLRSEKILIITASARTAIELAEHLKAKTTLRPGVFHENLSIIERDRAAAYFSDMEKGCQLLICSEIGSEGRNFQFSHHLVLFDLPLIPDLLEQRIGRLDRIGQKHDISVHVPYFKATSMEVLFDWYNAGLGLFKKPCSSGNSIFQILKERLAEAMRHPEKSDHDLIDDTRAHLKEQVEKIESGRNKLLEYSSCDMDSASRIISQIKRFDSNLDLQIYLDSLYRCFGIDTDIHSKNSTVLHPNEYMQAPFPGLTDEGMTITLDRKTALENEDIHFLTWEHPFVVDSIDYSLNQEHGNTGLITIESDKIEEGMMLLEIIYKVIIPESKNLPILRQIQDNTFRLVIDGNGKQIDNLLTAKEVNSLAHKVPKNIAKQVIKSQTALIKSLVEKCNVVADSILQEHVKSSAAVVDTIISTEIDRLKTLTEINPNISEEEIEYFELQLSLAKECLSHSSMALDAVRIIINT